MGSAEEQAAQTPNGQSRGETRTHQQRRKQPCWRASYYWLSPDTDGGPLGIGGRENTGGGGTPLDFANVKAFCRSRCNRCLTSGSVSAGLRVSQGGTPCILGCWKRYDRNLCVYMCFFGEWGTYCIEPRWFYSMSHAW